MSTEASVPAASLDDVVRLLSEQNELLKKLAGNDNLSAKASRFSDEEVAKVKTIAARIPPTEEEQYVAVNLDTGEFATGNRIFQAARKLGAPPRRTLVMPLGGRAVRLRSPRLVR